MPIFPPKPRGPVRLAVGSRCGYKHEQVLITKVETDANGMPGHLHAEPGRLLPGDVDSPDRDPSKPNAPLAQRDVVTAETTIWAASHDVRDIGTDTTASRSSSTIGLRVGQTAPVMIVTPSRHRWVLFSIDADSISTTASCTSRNGEADRDPDRRKACAERLPEPPQRGPDLQLSVNQRRSSFRR